MIAWLAQFTAAFALWFLYVGHFELDEVPFAIVASAITASAARVVLEHHLAPLRTGWRSVAQVWRLPKYMIVGGWEIIEVLAKDLLGKRAESLLYSVPFDAGGDDDESAFRRALAIGYTTATPNFVVLGVDREHGRLVYHQIKRSAVPEMTKRLGARP